MKKTDTSINRVSNMKGVIKLKPIKKPPTGVPRKLLVTISIPNNLPFALGRLSLDTICGRNA